jgi:hypothetical protein
MMHGNTNIKLNVTQFVPKFLSKKDIPQTPSPLAAAVVFVLVLTII